MKKIVAMLMALVMMLSLCACGAKTEAEIRGQVTAAGESAAEAESVGEAAAEAEAELGTVNGGRYESSFLGIGCELDENWSYYSQEDMASLLGMTADMFEDENYAEQVKDADMFYDMYAAYADGTCFINVLVQNLGLLYGTVLTEEEYVKLSTESLSSQLESAGFTDVEWEIVTLDFAGQQRQGLKISSMVQGVPYYCTQAYIKSGSHMAIISLACYVEDISESLAEYFFAV